jgi:putative tryptophan/tyrosine transport system substrate-binding protein
MGRSTVGVIITLALALLAVPLVSDAQQARQGARIGYLSPVSPGPSPMLVAFQQGLGQLGWVEGKNLAMEYRWAEGRLDQLPALAAELVRLNVEVIVTWGPGVRAAQQATGTIPIVIASTLDAVQDGVVASLARPGGNITGLTLISTELMGKRLELLKQAFPTISRVALLTGPAPRASSAPARLVQEAESAAQALGMTLHTLEVRDLEDVTSAFTTMARERPDALYVLEGPTLFVHQTRILDFAAEHRLPTMFGVRGFVDAGGLMSYGPNVPDLHRRAASYVDKILKGANPAELPVEQPTKFELVINLKTAQALGLTMPPTVLFQADEVIR